MRTTFSLLVSITLLSMFLAPGCTVQVAPAPAAVVVDQGYYVDGDYVDEYGVYHPREYYYYDGYAWNRRDSIPPGFVAHDRGHGFVQAQIRRGPPGGGRPGFHDQPHLEEHHDSGPERR